MSTLSTWQKLTHAWAIRKEWRGPNATQRPFVADLALFHSEVSEALEEIRKNPDPKYYYETYTVEYNGVVFKNITFEQACALLDIEDASEWELAKEELGLVGKPEGVGPELADLAIRVLETCEEYGLDLDFEIERKMTYNEGRELRHGGLLM